MSGTNPEPIAIIGSACRFPGGASTPSKLWDLLSSPRDLLSKISTDRFDPDVFYHPDGEHHGGTNVKHSYLLSENTRCFDAPFFSINPREAESMDPQHRILLETVYESLESAGAPMNQLQGSQTGVYVGLMTNDYHDVHLRDMETIPKYTGTGTTRSILSNRISHFFDWKGPSMTIDTACSSSLVAVHLAVQSLRSGESRLAVAAGANLIFGPEMYIIESKLHMLSPNGRSRMWDDKADGYGRGEGVATVLLKTLSTAIQDGDHIECIIRETGVNQDGRTPGITIPSPLSQETLIRDTYRRAGLDLRKREDRPQFFEAHGTGTLVGDPLEAEAISNAFFGDETNPAEISTSDVLYVGGIKTVIGHLEGAAGIAGLLKTSLALRQRILPPNMHLDNLNPKVAAFTKYLSVPTAAIPWPQVPGTGVRRASVNSFGFGGTNAHAILESFDGHESQNEVPAVDESRKSTSLITPLVFSAYSDASLVANVKAFSEYLATNKDSDILNVAWSLQARRTEFSHRKAFSGSDVQQLLENISLVLERVEETPSATLGTQALRVRENHTPKILGVFTGQGAQWPTMGAELLQTSRVFRRTIESLEEALGRLADKPTWSILQELQADNTQSRLHLAEISQPLCTAVQVGLVDLIRSAGISFGAVVGHSSGEIGAAYAAGVISANDAIRIAYYRGVHTKLAAGKDGQLGTMLAAGLSLAQAQSFCQGKQFAGRIAVAASNGPSTVTISGDEDAIQELKMQLDEQKIFARMLKVDKAYHSHHMYPCSEPYLKSLQSCNIQINKPGSDSAQWVSSVHGAPDGAKPFTIEDVCDIYWVENMTNSVLFSQAVERAIAEYGPFDIAIEIGPHAALKGPTTQTVKAITGDLIPYQGILHRGKSDAEAFQSAVGFVWEHLGSKGVNLSDFTASLLEKAPIFQKGLPTYQWDHGKQYWKESRLSKNFRTRGQQIHELLGKQCNDNVDAYDLRWRNILSIAEMPWLRGHKFQNQILFPAAGHIALALEASKALSAGREVQLIELEDISVGKAITFDDDGSEVEILFTLKTLSSSQESVSGQFACYACHNEVTGNMDLCSSGRITLLLGTGSTGVLPDRPKPISGLVRVDTEDFYASMDQIGLDYTGDFRKIDSIFRTRLHASASTIKPNVNTDYAEAPIVHPALLDVCFQTVIAAFCFPGDGSFWTPYLPTSISRIRVNPILCNARENPHVSIDAYITKESSLQIIGDLNAYNSLGQQEIQLEGLLCSSFSKATPATDQRLFSETVWKPALMSSPDDILARKADKVDNPVDLDAIELNERVAYFYLRTLRERFTAAEVATFEWWYQRLFEFADHLLPLVANGDHPSIQAEWANDTYDLIQHLVQRHPDQIDLQLVVEVGEHLPTFVRGKVPLLEVMMKEDRLTRLYQDGLGVPEVNKDLSAIAKQISHQYPSMKILEIGAGTGGMTREVLREIDGGFSFYTFTDISTGFFEKSQERLQTFGMGRMIFSALDIEKDPATQGYALGSYDVIIASNVLHATRNLGETMANVRKLLRPGGYLLLNEVTGEMLRLRFIMSGLPGWWLGADDGRRFAPTINSSQWDEVMRNSGFSGVDVILQDFDAPSKQSLSVMVTQAVDEMVDFLREPLLSPYMAPEIDELFIVGGKDLQNRRLARSIGSQLRSWIPEIKFVNDILTLEAIAPKHGFTVVCLEDLDSPVLRDITTEKLRALQLLFSEAKHILYLTRGSRTNSPYSMAMIGLGRTMLFEHPDLKLQFVDVATLADADARKIAEDLLRLVAAETLDPSYLWTAEPEIAYEESQKQIQRLVPNEMLNSKLNSNRRLITEQISIKQWQVVIGRNENNDIILAKGLSRSSFVNVPADHVVMDILVSSAHPISIIGEPSLYLCIGKQRDAESLLAVLSSTCASTVVVPTFLVCEIPNPGNLDLTTVLSSLAMHLVAQQILGTGSNIVLHEPDRQFATIFLEEASGKDISVTLTTSRRHDSSRSSWLLFHPYETRNRIAAALPSNVDVFIDFSSGHSSSPSSSEPLGERFRSCLPGSCLALSSSQGSWQNSPFLMAKYQNNSQELAETFSRVCLSSTASIEASEGHVVRVDEILANGTSVMGDKPFATIDWRGSSTVSIPIQPTITKNLFSPEKTYVLLGLSGEIGRSLSNYMIENGARYVVLTSRNPPSADSWLEEHRGRGVTVKVLANDITKKPEVEALIDQIRKTLPPIGGVANGAMVLQDKLFTNMGLEDWNKAVQPKINGSRNLDEIFSTDKSLEFFVMFSSLASVIGNSGQSNYNAGNMFCCALAANRRQRGLSASVLDIGKIVGIGYVARNKSATISLRSHKFQPISEPLFHHMFAEAVISGRQDSGRHPVLSASMQKRFGLAVEDSAPPLWLGNPRFSHMKWDNQGDGAGENVSAAATVPVKDLLNAAKIPLEAESILCAAFSTRLARILQMSADSINKNTPLIDIGIDSLIAVEVRTWFLKELNVDVPVLKVIGGDSIVDLCKDVLSRMPMEHIGEQVSLSLPTDHQNATTLSINSEPTFVLEKWTDLKASIIQVAELTNGVGSSDSGSIDQDSSSDALSVIPCSSHASTTQSTAEISPIMTPFKVEPDIPDSKWILTSNIKSEIEGEPSPQGSAPSRISRPMISRSGPLSHAQERLWLANNYIEDQSTYNVAFAWNLKGSLQVSKLQSALQAVVKRHEVLRTAFHLDEESSTPAQSVHKMVHVSFESRSVRPEVDVHTEFINFRDHVFDLKSGLTMKVLVLQVSDDLHVFMLCYHHIIMDGVSLRMFLYDLNRAYHSQSALLRPTAQYLDYTIDERNMMNDFNLKSDLQYWKGCFDRPVDPLPLLPCSRTNSRCPLGQYDTFTAHAFIDKEVVARIKENGRKVQATSFHVYAAAIQALLFRLLDGTTEELCFGIADSNRLDHRYLETLGFFLNLLPVRFQVRGESSFSELIKQTRAGIHGALAHSKVPFDVLLEELNVSRSSTYNPLFQVLLNHTLGFSEQATLAGCQMDIVEIEDASTACDLVVSIVETPGQDTAISFTMQKSLYLEEDCTRIISLYVDILDTLSKTPEIPVGDFPVFAKPGILQSMEVGRGLRVDSWDSWEKTISHQVDSIVNTYPDRVAVKLGFTDSSFTYRELNERAKYIAQNLVEATSTRPLRVAIHCDPCLGAIASILAILRIGGTYIPLDSRNPHERLSAIISDSSPTILLCDDKKTEPATDLGKKHDCRVINIASIPSSGIKFEENLADANSPAFTLYTSGSTGTPKGIMLNHKNWLNQFASVIREFGLKQENVLQQSSPGFDMAIEQTFISLCNGGTLIIAPHSIRGDAIELTRLMLAENITYTMAVPSEYSVMLSHGAEFLRQCKYWKYSFCGGEKITDHLREQFQGLDLSDLKLINVYGPTETTVSCCRGLVPLNVGKQNRDFCSVGQVLPNYAVYIVDTKGKLVPTGFPGEIYIGGIGVGDGYLNREELNVLKFLPDIYRNAVSDRHNEQELMYRSGDRGRLLADGSLVFMGRLDGDSQIKLRGQRVELDEIAHVIVQASKGTLTNAIVSARGDEPNIFLVAFVVFRNEFSTGNTERTSYLKSLRQQIPVPQYMRPATIVPLQELPVGFNGKVDRKAVGAFELPPLMTSELAVKDLSLNETRLLALWQEVLSQEIIAGFEIGRDTDFFEVGGNSLLMVRLQALIEQNVPIKIPLVEMVEFCSLGDMAQRVFSDDCQDSAQTVDWEQEALVPNISTVSNEPTLHPPSGDRKVVILTGATGFLGQHILELLVSSHGIAEVHCIAVRSTSSSPRELPIRSDKIFIHNGDLSLPRLGLTETEFASLSSRGDIIIHNGADVSFLKSYSSLKKSNVGSTSELILLSAPRRIPIHFVSSAGVAGFVPSELLPLQEISVKDYPPSEKSAAHGYQAAKWVSERLLEKAAAQYGIKVTLHRPTGIIGENASRNDIVANFLRYSRKLAAVPDMEGWDGYFDFVRVEEVAQTIYSSITRDWPSERLVTVIHDCNADAFPVHQLGRYLETGDKRPFATLPINEWIEQAGKVGMDEMVSMYLREVTLRRMGSYPRIKAR